MWMIELLTKCPHCGTRLEEWDPKEGGNRHAYIPQVYRCPGCATSGDALEAATKQGKATGGSHGLRVRLIPKYVADYKVKTRTAAEREMLKQREMEQLEMERAGSVDSAPLPRKMASLGGSRRPPPIETGSAGLAETPTDPESE